MQKIEAPAARAGAAANDASGLDNYLQIDLPRLLFWLRRGAKWIIAAALIGLLLGAGYAMLTKPRFTVTTDILMDPAGLQIVSDDLFRQDQQRDSQLLNVESKRQTLLSRNVLSRVVAALDLQNDPEFVPPPSPLSMFSIGSLLGGGGDGASRSPEVVALDSLDRRLSARRDEVSFVITMSVWTEDPEKSIRISQAIVTAFKDELVAADSEGASRTAAALVDRIDDLRGEVNAAEEAVEKFRRSAGLSSSQGELVSSLSMSQINQQLVEARARLIAAQSRYRELTTGQGADIAAMQSNTVSALRTQYATLKYQADAEALVYGPRHPRLVKQQTELRTLQAEIEAEKNRIIQAAKNELDQAQAVVNGLDAQASAVSSGVFSDNDAQVRLRELVREAAAKTAIYEAFLSRAREVTERQQLDTTNVRVISSPVMPRSRSWPPSTAQAAGFGAIGGMVLGVIGVLGIGIVADMGGGPLRPASPLAPGVDRRRPVPAEDEADEIPVAALRNHQGSLLNMWSGESAGARQ